LSSLCSRLSSDHLGALVWQKPIPGPSAQLPASIIRRSKVCPPRIPWPWRTDCCVRPFPTWYKSLVEGVGIFGLIRNLVNAWKVDISVTRCCRRRDDSDTPASQSLAARLPPFSAAELSVRNSLLSCSLRWYACPPCVTRADGQRPGSLAC
jgi:hypothetical protein